MEMILLNNILEMIGNTPIIKIESNIYAKLEFFNPFGSIKDRAAYQIITDEEKNGNLQNGVNIIEATSGNMGISLAAIGNIKGYQTTIVMPENMSIRRRELIKAFGGDLLLTKAEFGMSGAIDEAEKLTCNQGIYMTRQFENHSSVKAHYLTTAPEIDKQMNGKVDVIVCGIGTGGTITGIANYFYGSNVKIIGVEPEKSPFLTKGYSGMHSIQGIGAGFCPKILNIDLIHEIIAVSDDDALFYTRMLLKKYGLFVGISSGAVYCAALKMAEREEFIDKNIVIICADSGERYL